MLGGLEPALFARNLFSRFFLLCLILMSCPLAQALLRQGRHAEALAETRALTVEGDASAVEVLQMRAEALCASGNMERALKLYEEVRLPLLARLAFSFTLPICPNRGSAWCRGKCTPCPVACVNGTQEAKERSTSTSAETVVDTFNLKDIMHACLIRRCGGTRTRSRARVG